MKTLPFTKMHGLGNDFMMLNAFHIPITLSEQEIRYLGHRQYGIGFDQLLIVERPTHPEAQFKYRIFNTDGGEVEQCGNGARCFARFVIDQGLTNERTFCVETAKGLIRPYVEDDGQVTVNMGIPSLQPQSLPFTQTYQSNNIYTLALPSTLALGDSIAFSIASMGNPHAVIMLDDVEQAAVNALGSWLQTHPAFPNRINVGFCQKIDDHTIRLRVFERGVGETLACGTGACAAAAIGLQRGLLKNKVSVHMQGGSLTINWHDSNSPLFMTGNAITVFHGECVLPADLE